MEELYFRGYPLPRLAHLKAWAPMLGATLFGMYHFWQPYAALTVVFSFLPLAYMVWWKRNVSLSMAAHMVIKLIKLGLFFASIWTPVR